MQGKFLTCSVNLENELNSLLNTDRIILFCLTMHFVVTLQLLRNVIAIVKVIVIVILIVIVHWVQICKSQ